jgi:hypothetical protein
LIDSQLEQSKRNFDTQLASSESFYASQLAAAQSQINGLREVDDSILTVGDATALLLKAIKDELSASILGSKNILEILGKRNINEIRGPGGSVLDIAKNTFVSDGITYDAKGAGQGARELIEGNNFEELYRRAIANKVSSEQVAIMLQLAGSEITVSELLQMAKQRGLPAFAAGGRYGGGLALVGEEGPELINFRNPGMVYNADQTGTMLGSSVALVGEIKALREDNQAQARAMVQIQARLTKLMERWDSNGLPETRAVA